MGRRSVCRIPMRVAATEAVVPPEDFWTHFKSPCHPVFLCGQCRYALSEESTINITRGSRYSCFKSSLLLIPKAGMKKAQVYSSEILSIQQTANRTPDAFRPVIRVVIPVTHTTSAASI